MGNWFLPLRRSSIDLNPHSGLSCPEGIGGFLERISRWNILSQLFIELRYHPIAYDSFAAAVCREVV